MLETVFGLTANTALGVISILAALVSLITEVLKKIVPQSFPTKALAIIVSFVVTLAFVLIFYPITIKSVILAVAGSFVVSFISMYGWETLRDLYERFKYPY